MNKQPWDYIDTMNNPDLERASIEDNYVYNKLLETVEGDMDETDGWFKITLTTGATIEYKYVFRAHRKFERKGESYFKYRDQPTDVPINLDMDEYLDNYICMGPIYGALTMFIEVKLGLK